MMRVRRALLAALPALGLPVAVPAAAVAGSGGGADGPSGDAGPGSPVRLPRDHAAHPGARIEWWYVTGWLARGDAPAPERPGYGFQLTFFRNRTGLAAASRSRFAARQLVFAHAAVTDLGAPGRAGALHHDQRAAREGFGLATTPAPGDVPQAVSLGDWSLARQPAGPDGRSRLDLRVRAADFALTLALAGTQPPLLQGDRGWSRKGPLPAQASHYYSEPQLAARGTLRLAGAPALAVHGRAWLDHEWSDELMPADAVGWDWVGINLDDGAALTVFQLRAADGHAVWAGGSWRAGPQAPVRAFAPGEVRMTPGRTWRSPATGARYPVAWTLDTPAGRFTLRALLDDQELDSRRSTGSVYWEGVSELRGADGRRAGIGYLEMTGRAGRLTI